MTDERHDEPIEGGESTRPHESDRAPLAAWGAGWSAPASLRESTLRAARERGYFEGGTTMRIGKRFYAAAAVAAAITFGVGFGLGGARERTAFEEGLAVNLPKADARPRYALFLFENDRYQAPATDAAMHQRVGEYSSWAREIAGSGRFITGDKLGDDGRFCRLESGALEQSPPFADPTRGALAGYFVIEAANLQEALDIARGCPHLTYGGSVEVRPIEET